MIKLTKSSLVNEDTGGQYDLECIHPLTKEVILSGDGYIDIDDAAAFIADMFAAITDTSIEIDDIKEKIEVIE